ncbi:MAG: GIY-YIG nuclease family protein [Balneolaceae bacterium]
MIKTGEIFLSDVMPMDNQKQYKIHLAVKNEHNQQPLDAFVMNFEKWKGWNSYRGNKNRFNRAYIFSMMDFYPQNGMWLFGGIWKVLERKDQWYEIELTDMYPEMIGRLKIHFPYTARTRSLKLNRYYDEMTVHEILPKIYDGEAFRGYENIRLSYNELHTIINKQRTDWKTALENVYGVYLIMDKNNGNKYVGSAYGGSGIWSRWAQYIQNGHGGNTLLNSLIGEKGIEYARSHYQFSLLEYMPASTSDGAVINRENHWKEVLLSRGDYGYNAN